MTKRNKGCVLLDNFPISLLITLLIMAAENTKAQIPDVSDLFPEVADDLSKVSWAHAVNSKEELEQSIGDETIMMLEADILPGRLEGADPSEPTIPIMAHPPATESDISFEMWIDEVIKANKDGQKKGAKLDFKDISVVEECLKVLENRADQITFPLWLNADILKGPVSSTREPVDADKFLSLCVETFPLATLSVGWTTTYTSATDEKALYTKEMAEEMATALESKNVSMPVTFPIRAAFVPRSIEQLEWLVENIPDSTITVWSSSSDTIDVQALLALRDAIGNDSVYFDLPEEQKKEFDEAKKAEERAGAPSFRILPTNASGWATAAIALGSALAALYLYD
ncbi:protein FAM151B [Palaemon carinicauda]|uniref:protein FAM151B n=1 Tax=Palaemon carinicauda TaxID=392227 RepID=UPI0035B607D7